MGKYKTVLQNFLEDGYWLVPVLWWVTIITLLPYFGTLYSPDSYSDYMLGENLFSGNGYVTRVIRELNPDAVFVSRAFPPLFPIMIGLTHIIFQQKIASNVIVNMFVLYGIFHVVYLIGRNANSRLFYVLLLVSFAFILTNFPFAQELISGRSIPLAALLLLSIFHTSSVKGRISDTRYFFVGLLIGFLYLARFDSTLFCLAFPLFFCWSRKESYKKSLYIYAAFLLTISPWLIRNYIAFGTIFSSNQSSAVFSISEYPTPLSYFKYGFPSLVSDPNLWLKQRIVSTIFSITTILVYLTPINMLEQS